MTLKKTLFGITLAASGIGFAYATWNYMPKDTESEKLARPLLTLITGLAGVIARGSIIGKQLKENQPQNNPRNPNNLNLPQKRRYVETRTDEYGREYRIEREETIE